MGGSCFWGPSVVVSGGLPDPEIRISMVRFLLRVEIGTNCIVSYCAAEVKSTALPLDRRALTTRWSAAVRAVGAKDGSARSHSLPQGAVALFLPGSSRCD